MLDLRRLISGKRDVLLKRYGGLLIGKEVVDAIFECHAHEAEAIEGRRPHADDAGHRIERDLHRDRVIFLHLLGGEARRLRGDFENDGRGVGIGFDVELGEGDQARHGEDDDAKHNDCAAREPEFENGLQQLLSPTV